MTTRLKTTLPAIGEAYKGGFFAGVFIRDGKTHVLIDSGKDGELKGIWGEYGQLIEGANSYNDGRSNTLAMAESGSKIAKQALALRIGDKEDWYIPSRDEHELRYRNLKPTTQENYRTFRDGDNPSSVPVGYPYTESSPAQTSVAAYQAGGDHAFKPVIYWSSTQYSAHHAWVQHFDDGSQYHHPKHYEFAARAVRSEVIE